MSMFKTHTSIWNVPGSCPSRELSPCTLIKQMVSFTTKSVCSHYYWPVISIVDTIPGCPVPLHLEKKLHEHSAVSFSLLLFVYVYMFLYWWKKL